MSTQIHDLGYRAYTGERAGVGWAMRSLATHSVRRALGLKRSGKHKIVPIITIALAFIPAIIMAGISAFIPGINPSELLSYGEYGNVTAFAVFLFAAATAPGVLTTDRTSGMLAMYLASPLTRTTYVVAKAIGIFLVMLLVTVAPLIFLVIAFTFIGAGPGGVLDFIELFVRALGAGALTAAGFTFLSMFISAIPKRWGIASVSIVGAFFVPSIVVEILTSAGDFSDWFALIAPPDVIAEAWQRILNDPGPTDFAIDRLSSSVVIAAAVGYAVLFGGLTWWRYQTIEVDR